MEKYTVYDIINARCNSTFDAWNCATLDSRHELIFNYSGKVLNESDFDSARECARMSNLNGVVNNYCALRAVADSGKYTTLFQLWGWTRKNQVVVEIQKSVIKRNKIDLSAVIDGLALDKNGNFITDSVEQALAIIDSFMSQLYKDYGFLLYSNPIQTVVTRSVDVKTA